MLQLERKPRQAAAQGSRREQGRGPSLWWGLATPWGPCRGEPHRRGSWGQGCPGVCASWRSSRALPASPEGTRVKHRPPGGQRRTPTEGTHETMAGLLRLPPECTCQLASLRGILAKAAGHRSPVSAQAGCLRGAARSCQAGAVPQAPGWAGGWGQGAAERKRACLVPGAAEQPPGGGWGAGSAAGLTHAAHLAPSCWECDLAAAGSRGSARPFV